MGKWKPQKLLLMLFVVLLVSNIFIIYTSQNASPQMLCPRFRTSHTMALQGFKDKKNEMEFTNIKRQVKLHKACSKQETPKQCTLDPKLIPRRVLVERSRSIIYCDIAKIGSSFWKRALTVLSSGTGENSPFKVNMKKVAVKRVMWIEDEGGVVNWNELLKNAYSFTFVRDPYARIFSAYLDKIYQIDLDYWKTIGREMVRTIRRPPVKNAKFGYDVTFEEFVKYILKHKNEQHLDEHFMPMHVQCNPCDVPYDYIGHLETFQEDTEYLFDKWKSQFPDFNIQFSDFQKESAYDIATELVAQLFTSYEQVKDEITFSFYKLLVRIWNILQMRGYISKHSKIPFKQEDMKSKKKVTRDSVKKALKEAILKASNKTELSLQREEALIQAYRSISLADMEKLRLHLLKDCLLFDYEDRPKTLFDRRHKIRIKHNYFTGLK